MADVINLRQARKSRARNQAVQQAAESRARHGQSLTERRRKQAEDERKVRQLDAHRREPD